jgi:hypothetical protein
MPTPPGGTPYSLLVPMALDVLVVRDSTPAYTSTLMATPADKEITGAGSQKQLLPDPFGPDQPRAPGAYLHWSLPDALTRGLTDNTKTPPVTKFYDLPNRWIVIRMSGDITVGPRGLTAWLLPDINATAVATPPSTVKLPPVLANALGQATPADPPAGGQALTILGTGDLSWSAYFDNVQNILGLYDDLTGVSGAVSYLVCGWYTDSANDPFAAQLLAGSIVESAVEDFNWKISTAPTAASNTPTSLLLHGAAVGLGWPTASWPGDGGTLGVDELSSPDPATVKVAIADTMVEAATALGFDADDSDTAVHEALLIQATMAGMLSQLATVDGPAIIDTVLHASRFTALPSDDPTSETIWQPDGVTPAGPNAPQLAMLDGDDTPAAADGSLVDASRTTPRVFAPTDPVIAVEGAGRSFNHGGDARFEAAGNLMVRLPRDTVTWSGAAGTTAPDIATVLPASTADELTNLSVPQDVWPLLVEVAALDPASAPDLSSSTATTPSPDAAARSAWLDQPGTPAPAVDGNLPSPVGIIGPLKPWTPVHIEWALEWQSATQGAFAFTLGSVDFEVPASTAGIQLEPATTMTGRSLLSPSPSNIVAGGAQQALHLLRHHGLLDDHPFADSLNDQVAGLAAAGGSARFTGATGAIADQDLLGGSLEGFLAELRGQNILPFVGATGSTPPTTRSTNPNALRAGIAKLTRVRVVDAFGQYLDLLGSSATTTADQTRVIVGGSEVVPAEPGVIAMVPRFNLPAQVLLRYEKYDGSHQEADTSTSPLCGFVLPSPLDGSLEFFDANGLALGRLRPDPNLVTVWEEDPGQAASLGGKPSVSMANATTINAPVANMYLGRFADGLLASDAALAAAGQQNEQSALAALNQLIDTTRWTVDMSGASGDEHLALLIGHPVAVLRAGFKIAIQDVPGDSLAPETAVPVKLGTLAHSQDGLLGYFVSDDYTRVRAVDPAIGDVAPPGGTTITSTYVDQSEYFSAQPETGIDLTLLAVPASDVHATTGLLPQKSVGMRRDWVATGLARLSPNFRYGPVLIDRKATRVPVAADVHGTWSWHHRTDPNTWSTQSVVNATGTAIIPDDPPSIQYGWVNLQLTPEPTFPGIQLRITCITKPGGHLNPHSRISQIGGSNPDGTPWRLPVAQAVAMINSRRFSFYVQNADNPPKVAYVGVQVSPAGNQFLQTIGDTDPSDDLASLPECS